LGYGGIRPGIHAAGEHRAGDNKDAEENKYCLVALHDLFLFTEWILQKNI
jgi:hypothetical protein